MDALIVKKRGALKIWNSRGRIWPKQQDFLNIVYIF